MQRSSPKHPVTSRENKQVKYLRSLQDPKNRRTAKVFLVEGSKMVEESLREPGRVKLLIASPSLMKHQGRNMMHLAEERGVEILWISERLMDHVSESRTPQPILAVVAMRRYSEDSLLFKDPGLFLVAHELQDPGNLGTIIRTAEAAGAAGIGITRNTVDPYNHRSVRASMGSILRLPVAKIANMKGLIEKCKHQGFQTVAMTLNGYTPHFDLDLKQPTAIILGQESAGLTEEVLRTIDHRARIPMAANIDSLNVATSAAIILYEALRQRTFPPGGWSPSGSHALA